MHKAILFASNTLNDVSNTLQCEQYRKGEKIFLNKLTECVSVLFGCSGNHRDDLEVFKVPSGA